MNRRQIMYASNIKARNYILKEMKGSHVYFKEHTRRKSKFYNLDGFYKATDFFNLFDGLCFIAGSLCFFQVKTNQGFRNEKRTTEFLKCKHGFGVFAIDVRTKKKDLKVKWYTNEMYCM